MPKAALIDAPGGPEALMLREIPIPPPGKGEVRVRHEAIGLNYIDTYHRSGLYPLPAFPATLGIEACGIVEECGEGTRLFAPGDRVAYAGGPPGAYTDTRVLAEKYLVPVPEGIDASTTAAVVAKGLTAYYLLHLTYPVRKGDWLLIHAAAGGVGLLLCQWAAHLGARVIGTAGSDAKAEMAHRNGCEFTIVYTKEDFAARAREITGGRGVDVVYDSVGQSTFLGSLDCLRNFGLMVSFGQASGPIPPFDVGLLMRKGSLYLTRPSLMHHTEDYEGYARASAALFALMQRGVLKAHIGQTYPLSQVAQAHRDLEARKTSGSTVLIP